MEWINFEAPHEQHGAVIREFAAPVTPAWDATPALNESFAGTEAGVLPFATWSDDAAGSEPWLCIGIDLAPVSTATAASGVIGSSTKVCSHANSP